MANENEVLAKALVMSELKRNGQIGYTEPGKKLFTIELTDGQYLDATRKSGSLEIGKTYTVAVDGETYTCKGKDGSEFDADVCLGNLGLVGGTDTGEPFFVMETFDNGTDNVWVLAAITNNGASTISVSTADTIVPIKPEFLPGVCLPVVEITTELSEGVVFSPAECAAFDAACGVPAVIKLLGMGALLAEYINADGVEMFIGVSNMLSGFLFAKTDTGWIATQDGV